VQVGLVRHVLLEDLPELMEAPEMAPVSYRLLDPKKSEMQMHLMGLAFRDEILSRTSGLEDWCWPFGCLGMTCSVTLDQLLYNLKSGRELKSIIQDIGIRIHNFQSLYGSFVLCRAVK
jgi:hypothetical protein